MDQITKNLLGNFLIEQSLPPADEATNFEKFANYSVISHFYSDEFDVEDVTVAGEYDTGIDGVATIVNGNLVTSEEQVGDLADVNKFLEAQFVFIQSKTSSHFDGAEMRSFFAAVQDFFADAPTLPRNDAIAYAARIKDSIFGNSHLLSRGNPDCRLFYVTTGRWEQPDHIRGIMESAIRDLANLNLFENVTITPVDASQIQDYYKRSKNRVATTVEFPNSITLPEIGDVKESYLGLLPGPEYLKLITDDAGNIRKALFHDNVRDFQGDNPVNESIRETLLDDSKDEFAIRNNGVTIVAHSLSKVGNRFTVEDYQIVNGCQTSHVLFNDRQLVDESLQVPVKLIVTENEAVINAVIRSSNRQTQVRPEELEALSAFQRKLEDYYDTFADDKALYYERRSKQYSGETGIEKVRIVSIGNQIRYFSAMFLDEAYRAGRYYSTLLKMIGENLFGDNHEPAPYYTSAYAAYRLEWLFRNAFLDNRYRIFRYHVLMVTRHQLEAEALPRFNSRRIINYCDALNVVFQDVGQAAEAFENAISVVDGVLRQENLEFSRDTAKTQTFRDSVLAALG